MRLNESGSTLKGSLKGKSDLFHLSRDPMGGSLAWAELVVDSLEREGYVSYEEDYFSAERLPANWCLGQ